MVSVAHVTHIKFVCFTAWLVIKKKLPEKLSFKMLVYTVSILLYSIDMCTWGAWFHTADDFTTIHGA